MDEDIAEKMRDIVRFHIDRYLPDLTSPKLALVRQLAAAHEINLIAQPENTSFTALAIELTDGCRYVCYNTRLPEELQAFYVAHELGHFVAGHIEGWDAGRETMADMYALVLMRMLPQQQRVA